jgi:hypothetical protein
VLGVAVLGETGLRVAALFVNSRATDWRQAAKHRILCVGDSHTYGVYVPADETYPAHLQQFLDRDAPGNYAVVNLGIPGMNTAQVRNHLPAQVEKYRPDIVVVWGGANNTWNIAEVDDQSATWRMWLASVVNRIRIYRFMRIWVHDLWVERDFESIKHDLRSSATGRITKAPEISIENPWVANTGITVRHWDGTKERLENELGDHSEALAGERALRDFAAIAEYARSAGIRLLFVLYPTEFPAFAFANQAMRRVAEQYGLAVVDSAVSLQRVAVEDRKWLPAVHPTGPVYREIARDLAGAITREALTSRDQTR